MTSLGLLLAAAGALAAWFGFGRGRKSPRASANLDVPASVQPSARQSQTATAKAPSGVTASGVTASGATASGATASRAPQTPRTAHTGSDEATPESGTAYGPNGASDEDDEPAAVADSPPATVLVLHLVPAETGWQLRREGDDDPLERFPTKKSGLDAARRMAREQEPSRLVVHRLDGTIQNQFTYGDR